MTADAKATKWMAREIAEAKDYPGMHERTGGAGRARQKLAEYVEGAGKVGGVMGALRLFAEMRGAAGCAAVIAGDERGYLDLDLACLYNYWLIRLLARNYDLNQRPDKQGAVLMGGVATCWMHAEAIGAVGLRRWLDGLVERAVAGYGGVKGRNMSALTTLVAHYVTARGVSDLEREGWGAIDAYACVAGGTFVARDYDKLAAYHQSQTDGEAYPPFVAFPYTLVPFELLVVARRTGIPIEGSHPLLTSPLARVRDVPEIPMTEELRSVVDRASKDLSFDPRT